MKLVNRRFQSPVKDMNKISRYFRGVGEEARRIRWPDGKTLFKAVAVVLVIAIICALAMSLFDFLSSQIMKAFEDAFPKKDSASDSATEAVAMLVNTIYCLGGR